MAETIPDLRAVPKARAYAELKVDTMLTKPFDVQELREVIDTLSKVA